MPVFRPFGPDHWLVLGLVGGVSAALVAGARGLRCWREERIVRLGFAVTLGGNAVISWGVGLSQGQARLPCQLCDLAVLVMAGALLTRHRVVGELAICWGLAGSLQAVLTPDLMTGFPTYPWISFFVGHSAVVISAVYLLAQGRMRLSAGSVWRVWAMSNVYALVAGLLNWCLGENFGYLARKPAHPSLLDWLGPWPWYVVGIEVVALGLFGLCVALNRVIDRWATS